MYIDKYSGPEYKMDVRYANVLNVVFVTMVFGVAIPVLFKVSAIFFVI
jgi:hypothetical protein